MKALKILAVLTVLIATQSFGAATSIVKSKHNLSFAGVTANGNTVTAATATDANGEICVFCHTPHASNSAFDGAPLWNKGGSTTAVKFIVYGAATQDDLAAGATLGGTVMAAGTVNSPSRACLSCHDGVSAINSLVNAPGSGMGTAAELKPAMTGVAAGSELLMPSTAVTSIGKFGSTGLAAEDADLRNDHPVSVQYSTKASLVPIDGAIGAGSMASDGTAYAATWSTPSGGSNISDILRGSASDYVECGTCHDPHLGPGTGQELFLRTGTNAGSQLCLGCHAK